MLRRIVLCAPLLVAACVVQVAPPPPEPHPVPHAHTKPVSRPVGAIGPLAPATSCSEANLDPARFIGRRPEDVDISRYAFPVRVIAPGSLITMDYLPTRLNIETNAAGLIVAIRCG